MGFQRFVFPLQSVLNAAVKLIARLPRNSNISAFMFDDRHWLPNRIQLKVLALIYRSYIGQSPWYLRDIIRLPSSDISLRSLRSLDRHDLFVPRARTWTSMAQTRDFAITGLALWNQFPPSTRPTLLTGEPNASFRSLKAALYSLGLSHWKRFWLVCTAWSAVYM